MRTPSTVLRAVVVAGLLLAPTLTGCGGEPEAPGVTDEEVRIGTTLPLSGPLATSGTAALGGLTAYFKAVNDTGGVLFKDGTQRKVHLVHYDDGHDATRAVGNYRRLVDRDRVFALVQTFGTAPNLELMKLANRDKVPQVFVHSGATEFNADRKHNEWTIGWQPMYQTEGVWHALMLASRDEKLRVAVLNRDDDIGRAFVDGFEHALEGSKVKIVARQTYQPGATDLDRQVGKLARSKADLLLSVVPDTDLQAAALRRVRDLDWSATVLLTSQNSSIERVIKASGVTEGVRATGFVKQPDDPQWSGDPDVREYLDRMRRYSPGVDPTLPNAEWGYSAAATFAKVLEGMAYVSREQLMESVDEVAGEGPLLLPGVKLDGISKELPPVHGVWLQEFRDGKWVRVEPHDERR